MSEHVWTENTKPDRPGIWAYRTSTNRWVAEHVTAANLGIWGDGTWAFICDLPDIKDPPKYRDVTPADVGREIEVFEKPSFFIGLCTEGYAVYEWLDECGLRRHPLSVCRILDDGQPAKQPREWWIEHKILERYGFYGHPGHACIHVREVID